MIEPPQIERFGVWIRYKDGTNVMIVNDRPYKFSYEIDQPVMPIRIDAGFKEWGPAPDMHIKAEFDCKDNMYVTDGREFLRKMDPSQFDAFHED